MPADLESLTQGLFDTCDERLGDSLTITPPAASAITPKANVDYGEKAGDFGGSAAIVQDIAIDIDMSILPGRPGAGWRITLPRISGKTFEPRDVRRDDSGLRWVFGVKEVHA